MKLLLQYFIAPLLAATVALLGNYWLVTKPQLNKEYTKIGLDILLQKDAPIQLRNFAQQLLNDNSPVKLSESEKNEKLEFMLHNIPAGLPEGGIRTNGDLAALAALYVKWASEVRKLCPECVSEQYLREQFEVERRGFRSLANQAE